MKGPGKLLSHRMLPLTFLCLWFATLIPLPKASRDTVAFILLQLYALTQRTFSQTYLHRQPIRPTPLGVSSLWVLCTKAAGKPSAIMYTKTFLGLCGQYWIPGGLDQRRDLSFSDTHSQDPSSLASLLPSHT